MSNPPDTSPEAVAQEQDARGALLRSDSAAPVEGRLPEELDSVTSGDTRQASLWSDAWRQLRRNPVFVIAGALLAVLTVMAVFPQLFTNADPLSCNLANSRG